jgi:hypothetical protein
MHAKLRALTRLEVSLDPESGAAGLAIRRDSFRQDYAVAPRWVVAFVFVVVAHVLVPFR